MKKRGDRFLIWALAISFGLHAIVLVLLHHAPVEARAEQTPAPVTIDARATPPPTPTPPIQTPQPALPRTTVAATHLAPPLVHNHGGGPVEPPALPLSTAGPLGPVDGPGSPGPVAAPTESPRPQCSVPDAPATVIDTVNPERPEDADDETGTAQVRVDLAPSGAVVNATIYHSAGNMLLDRAALRAARASTYRAELRDCASVGGSYLFTVDFTQ